MRFKAAFCAAPLLLQLTSRESHSKGFVRAVIFTGEPVTCRRVPFSCDDSIWPAAGFVSNANIGGRHHFGRVVCCRLQDHAVAGLSLFVLRNCESSRLPAKLFGWMNGLLVSAYLMQCVGVLAVFRAGEATAAADAAPVSVSVCISLPLACPFLPSVVLPFCSLVKASNAKAPNVIPALIFKYPH